MTVLKHDKEIQSNASNLHLFWHTCCNALQSHKSALKCLQHWQQATTGELRLDPGLNLSKVSESPLRLKDTQKPFHKTYKAVQGKFVYTSI